eukprot:COSAG01_NODE_2895_length_6901_cov_35.009262_3_plen_131_part_00
MHVHWVAVPQALRARRVNRQRLVLHLQSAAVGVSLPLQCILHSVVHDPPRGSGTSAAAFGLLGVLGENNFGMVDCCIARAAEAVRPPPLRDDHDQNSAVTKIHLRIAISALIVNLLTRGRCRRARSPERG